MKMQGKVLGVNVGVETKKRKGYFAARTKPFALTAYAKTELEVEERAFKMVKLLLGQYSRTPDELQDYLISKGIRNEQKMDSL